MAGTVADMYVYPDEFHMAVSESVAQNSIEMNAGSGGAINFRALMHRGDLEKETFFNRVEGLVSRRDNTSVADVDDKNMAQGELVAVKINTKIGPVANTIDSFKKIAQDPRTMSFVLGGQYGEDIVLDYVNTGLSAVTAALESETDSVVDVLNDSDITDKTLSHIHIVSMLAAMGDRASRIKTLVMHAKPFYDLLGDAITNKISNVADVAIYEGTTATLGRQVLVTDSPALIQYDDDDSELVVGYKVVGLVEGALEITESEDRTIHSELVTGKESLLMRLQGEMAHSVGVKGFAYGGPTGPTDAELGDTANWTRAVTTIKNGPGVQLLVE